MANFAWLSHAHFGERLTPIALHKELRLQWARSRGGHPLHAERAPQGVQRASARLLSHSYVLRLLLLLPLPLLLLLLLIIILLLLLLLMSGPLLQGLTRRAPCRGGRPRPAPYVVWARGTRAAS